MFTDDPILDWNRHTTEEEKIFATYPICCDCGNHIVDGYAYEIDDEFYCEDCMKSLFGRDPEDLRSDEEWIV